MRRCRDVRSGRWVWQIVLTAAIAVLACGCGTSELRTVPLTASRTPFVRDIPVPMSFELVDDLSQSYRTQAERVAAARLFRAG